MLIYLATSKQFPNGTQDDSLLVNELMRCGHQVEYKIWNEFEQWQNADKVIIRSTWDYHQHVNEFLLWCKRVSSSTELLNSYQAIIWNYDKTYLKEIDESVETAFCSKDDLVITCKKFFENHDQIIVKPTISASAQGLKKLSRGDDLSLFDQLLEDQVMMVQPFLKSIVDQGELSLIFFSINGKFEFSHSAIKNPGANDFRVQEEYGGSTKTYDVNQELIHFSKRLLDSLKFKTAFARVDIVDWNTLPLVSEVELIEPDLYMRCFPEAAKLFVKSLGLS